MNEPGASVVHHPAETELFADTLTCDVALPASFDAGNTPIHPGTAEMLLRSVALVEDSRSTDEDSERGDSSLQVQRLEARMDLVLVLLGRLLRKSNDALPLRPLRWSRRGLRMELGQRTGNTPGSAGIVHLQPADWLPDHIELPVQEVLWAMERQGVLIDAFLLAQQSDELGRKMQDLEQQAYAAAPQPEFYDEDVPF